MRCGAERVGDSVSNSTQEHPKSAPRILSSPRSKRFELQNHSRSYGDGRFEAEDVELCLRRAHPEILNPQESASLLEPRRDPHLADRLFALNKNSNLRAHVPK